MKKIIYLLTPIMCFSLLVSCGESPTPPEPSTTYEVTCNDNIVLSNYTATNTEDYNATITTSSEDIFLPKDLETIAIANKPFTYFNYNVEENLHSATLHIPYEYITGDIKIDINYGYKIQLSNNIKILDDIAYVNTAFESDFYTEGYVLLPEEENKPTISVNGTNIEYDYKLNEETHQSAHVVIDGSQITGQLTVNAGCGYLIECPADITLSSYFVEIGKNCDITITAEEGVYLPMYSLDLYIGGEKCTNYTYQIDDDYQHANLHIDARYIDGFIDIRFLFVYEAICTNNYVKVTVPYVVGSTDFKVDLIPLNNVYLPNELNKLTIDSVPISKENYKYEVNENKDKGTITVDKQLVKGPIIIDLSCDYGVSTNNKFVSLENPKVAEKGKLQSKLIPFDENIILPNELNSIKVADKTLVADTDYTYNEGNLVINEGLITGPVRIDLTCDYKINVNSSFVKLTPNTVTHGTDFELKMETTEKSKAYLTDQIKVFVNNKECKDYFYYLESDKDTATLKIDKKYITGPINIELLVGRLFKVSLSEHDFGNYRLDNTKIDNLADYETKIEVNNAQWPDTKVPDNIESITCNGEIIDPSYYSLERNPYDKYSSYLKVNKDALKGDIVISLGDPIPLNWYDYYDWWNRTNQASEEDIGKEVLFGIGSYKYRIRIVDINRDVISGGDKKAKVTFEFEDLLRQDDDEQNAWKVKYHNAHKCDSYAKSSLNSFLNNDFYNILKNTIGENIIKKVKKDCNGKSVDTHVFLLSMEELNLSEYSSSENAYKYYENGGSVYKYLINDGGRQYYWTRSFDKYYPGSDMSQAYAVTEGDYPGMLWNVDMDLCFAPAFCI